MYSGCLGFPTVYSAVPSGTSGPCRISLHPGTGAGGTDLGSPGPPGAIYTYIVERREYQNVT